MDLSAVRPYPLIFSPRLKEKVWGGQRLTHLHKPIPQGMLVGESWELVDLPEDQSVVASGPASGASLGELVRAWGARLMGTARLDGGHFPLLVKYIDASQTLSVQVHPDEQAASRLGGRPKGEAWYILQADPGAVIYRGLKPGVDRRQLGRALEAGTVEELLVTVPAWPGDLIPVPSGTVHAIGGGVLLAEVQQPSDTTYRVFDWNRPGLDGKPRSLHIEEAIESIHFGDEPPPILREGSVDVALFRFNLAVLEAGEEQALAPSGPVVLVGLAGVAIVEADNHEPIGCARGQVVLVPEACRPARVRTLGQARFLEVLFPGA